MRSAEQERISESVLWDSISDVFGDALELPCAQRAAFLESRCGDSETLRKEVERLLGEHDAAGHFLETPAMGAGTTGGSGGTDGGRVCQDGDLLAGRFRVVRLLGSGGMGEVYEAFDSQLRGRVAVKTLREAGALDEKMVEGFRTEVLRSRQITHPNVGRVYDLFIHRDAGGSDMLFFTMELLEGETLAQWLARCGPFTPEAALKLLRQICAALGAAHSAGIIHRDLKPGNIFLSHGGDGEVRATVTDFGIAGEAGSPASEGGGGEFTGANSSVLAGTPAYMAPEQMRGEPGTAATDVYSLALVVCEMLSGRGVYEGKSPLACALKKLGPEQASPPEIEGLPSHWTAAIRRALRHDPGQRFASPIEFVAALDGEATRVLSRRRLLYGGVSAAAGIAAAGAAYYGAYYEGWLLPLGFGQMPSLAVLPFDNLGGDPKMLYFSDGVCEELTHAMTSYRNLYVAAQNASFRFRNGSVPAAKVAETLGVKMLLTGSIRRSEDRLRISVQLVEGSSGRQVWSQIYDRDAGQVFAIQADIVKEVALKMAVSGASPDAAAGNTKNTEAYDLYLKGRYEWNKRTRNGMFDGLAFFEQATRLDGGFALAWAGIADCYLILGDYGWMLPADATPKIRTALDRSLAIAPNSAETLASLGLFHNVFTWDQAGAERAFQRALSLKPSLFVAHSWYGNFLMLSGRWDEALREAEAGRRLDPVSLPTLVFLGWVRYYRREYDKAVEIGKQAVALNKSFPHGHQLLAMSYGAKGNVTDALKQSDEAFRLTTDRAVGFRYRAVALSQIPALEREAREAAAQVELLSQDRQAGYLAIAYAGMADRAKTYEWIRRGVELHDSALHMTIISPQLDRYRKEAQFKELVRQLGYPEQRS